MIPHLFLILIYAYCFATSLSKLHNTMIMCHDDGDELKQKFHNAFGFIKFMFVMGVSKPSYDIPEDFALIAWFFSAVLMWFVMHFLFEVKLNTLRGLHPYYVSFSEDASYTDRFFVWLGKKTKIPATTVSKVLKIITCIATFLMYLWVSWIAHVVA